MRTKFILFVVAAAVSSALVFQSCSTSEEPLIESVSQNIVNSKYDHFLIINNLYNRKTTTEEEKAIFNEARKRIVENLKSKDGYLTLEGTTATELNMDESLFNLFDELYKYSKISANSFGKSAKRGLNKRMKVASEDDGSLPPPDPCTIAYNTAMAFLNDKEEPFFQNYWNGTGENMNLTASTTSDLVNSEGRNVKATSQVNINGKQYTRKEVDYTNTQYHWAIGSSGYEYYDSTGKCVGFKDSYDFNDGKRPGMDEEITKTVGIIGEYCNAKGYNIYYGIHE